MNVLLIVNESPWGSSLANTALRFLRAALGAGHQVPAVFFHDEGVYNAQAGRVVDPGAMDRAAEWLQISAESGVDMLLCSSAAARRLPDSVAAALPAAFKDAGLARMLELMNSSDRVVTF